jgi:signal transduction histidine kinase/streptogramin lyase
VVQVLGAGASSDYLTDVKTADDGLPDSSVTAIAQTPDGYLWIGTYNGLARFDGLRFVTFDPANTPALTHARIRKLSVDDQGTLWINAFDGSVTSLRQGSFALEWTGSGSLDPDVTLVSSSSNQVTLLLHRGFLRRKAPSAPAGTGWEDLMPPSRAVGALCLADRAGTVWYRGQDKGLWRLVGKEFELLPPAAGLSGTRINCMTTDPQGRLWVGTEKEIAFWDGTRFQNVTPTNAGPAEVTFLSVGEGGQFWAVVDGQVRKAVEGRWVLEVESLRNIFTGNLTRMGGRPDHRGGVWFYDYGRGLLHVNAKGVARQFGPQDDFPGERIGSFFEDREGNWWAGLDAGGLVRIRERRFQTVDTSAEVSTKPAKSVCEASDGTVWIGTLGDGLARLQAGAVTNLNLPGGTGKGFAFCVCPDAEGRLWVSAGEEDLFVLEENELKRVSPLVHGVKAILAARAGRVWVGTRRGLYVSEPGAPTSFKQHEGIGRTDVRALSEDSHGNLWVGAEDGTLFRVNGNTVTPFHPTDSKRSQAIWSLLAEEDGTVWVGTFRGGLLRLRDGQFTRFGLKDGLPDNIICQILSDDRGDLWLGSHLGVFRVSKTTLDDYASGKTNSIVCTAYGRSDGLPSLECSGSYQPAAWRAQDGRLWFTTLKGAVWVQPEEVRPNLSPPNVVIEEVLIDGHPPEAIVESRKLDPLAAAAIQPGEWLEIPPGKHQFEFRYTGLSLVSSDRVQFRYWLEGADPGWVDAGTRRSAQYNLLPHGEYRFHVMARNSDGVWNEKHSTYGLRILPHFYETWWFRVLTGLVIVATAVGTIRHTATRRLQRKMEKLERQHAVERERARIAKDIHDDLGASLTLIAVLGDLARKEKAAERLEKMSATARLAIKSLDEIVWAVNPRNDTLAHLIDYAGQFATDYLRAAGIRCLLDVPEQPPAREVPTNVRHNVFLVIKEALQNIVKHAHATEVWLRISAGTESLRVVIEDNGCGFADAPTDPWADGLENMRQRLTEIGGECRIQSHLGTGTTITIEQPWLTHSRKGLIPSSDNEANRFKSDSGSRKIG